MRRLLVPALPPGGGSTVLSLIGGIGGSITILSYNYWVRESGITNRVAGSANVPRNAWAANALLVLIMSLFLGIGAQELAGLW